MRCYKSQIFPTEHRERRSLNHLRRGLLPLPLLGVRQLSLVHADPLDHAGQPGVEEAWS